MVERHPRNAPGPFYTDHRSCISCDAPRYEAPGLITLDDDGCYFHKQPETPEEVNQAIRAMHVSCIEAYRYGGNDPRIRRRLAQVGYAHLCDRPLEGERRVLRDHVRFELDSTDAVSTAAIVLSGLGSAWKSGACTQAVSGDVDTATFGFTTSREYGTNRRYEIKRISHDVSPTTALYRAPTPPPTWLLVLEASGSSVAPIHDALVERGAQAIRWFSVDEWLAGAEGVELPY